MAKKKSVAALKRSLWKIFTAYVKARDNYTCVTCRRKVEGANAQGGHYIAKAACGLDYYFSETNVHCQCANCNLRLEGNRPAYREYIVRTYGLRVLADLEQNYHKPCKWSQGDFEEKIALYTAKLSELSSGDTLIT